MLSNKAWKLYLAIIITISTIVILVILGYYKIENNKCKLRKNGLGTYVSPFTKVADLPADDNYNSLTEYIEIYEKTITEIINYRSLDISRFKVELFDYNALLFDSNVYQIKPSFFRLFGAPASVFDAGLRFPHLSIACAVQKVLAFPGRPTIVLENKQALGKALGLEEAQTEHMFSVLSHFFKLRANCIPKRVNSWIENDLMMVFEAYRGLDYVLEKLRAINETKLTRAKNALSALKAPKLDDEEKRRRLTELSVAFMNLPVLWLENVVLCINKLRERVGNLSASKEFTDLMVAINNFCEWQKKENTYLRQAGDVSLSPLVNYLKANISVPEGSVHHMALLVLTIFDLFDPNTHPDIPDIASIYLDFMSYRDEYSTGKKNKRPSKLGKVVLPDIARVRFLFRIIAEKYLNQWI